MEKQYEHPSSQCISSEIISPQEGEQLQPGQLLRVKNYSYFLAQPHHRQELLRLIIDSRSKTNPLVLSFLKFQPDSVYENNQKQHWLTVIDSFVSNNLSVVCCDRSNNSEIVATSCGICYASAYKGSFGSKQCTDDYSDALYALYSKLSAMLPAEIKEKLSVEGLVSQLGGCSSKETLKERGIFRQTVPLVFELSAKQGFKYAYSYVVSGRARNIITSFGMKVVAEVDLWSFQNKGMKPFAAIEEENRYPCLLWKEIA